MTKLTYEQMRQLSELGDPSGRLTIKDKKGHVLKTPERKWHQSPTTASKSSGTALTPFHAHTGNHSLICLRPTC
jgi:hypothetical protein